MATTVTDTKPLITTGFGGGRKSRGPNGNGGPKRNGHDGMSRLESSANRYRIGMWVSLASILMMFTALTSAYIVRAASSTDWQPLSVPRVLWLSTALIVISSVTLETARRKLKENFSGHRLWLLTSAALGFAFLFSQLFAWRQLVQQGIYVSSNPHSSFFYLLTATHGVHLVGGLIALLIISLRARVLATNQLAVAKRQAATDAMAIYWHFLDLLWIYLFVLLFFWRS
jgi:cytochrome c oxidase subunit 3